MKPARFISAYAAWVVRRRVAVLLAVALVVGLCGAFLGRLSFDTNYRIWFEEDDPYLVSYDRFVREFGNDDSFVVAFEDEQGILRPEALQAVRRLTDRFWQLRGVIRVDSLANFQATRATADGIAVEDLVPAGATLDAAELGSIGDYIEREPLIIGALLSANRQVAVIRGKFAPSAISPELPKEVYTQLTAMLDEETARSGYRFHFAGGPITDQAFDMVAQADGGRLMPMLLVVMIAILALMFWSWWGVLLPIGTGLLTVVATLGISGALDFKLNQVTASSPQLLIGISVATVMHLLSSFVEARRAGMDAQAAARHAVEDNFVPIMLTNLATALGFASFMVGNVVPVSRLGFVACLGSMMLTFFALTVVPAVLSWCNGSIRRSMAERFDLSRLFQRTGAFAVRNSGKVILGWIAVTAAAAVFMPRLVVDSNPLLYFQQDYWFRQSIDFMEKRGSGGAVYELVLRGDGPDAIKTVDYMRDLDSLSQYLANDAPGDFRNVFSLSTVVRNINRALHADDDAFHVIPDSDDAIAQYLLLYTLSVPVGQDINDRMNVDNSASRITVVRPLVSTRESRHNMDVIQAWADANLHHARVEFTGRDVLYTNMGNNITESLIQSLGFDVLTILPLLLLMFRTLTASVVSVFANVGPLVIVLGFMAVNGVMLDVGTLMVAALGLGIAVDDTVHLLAHYFRHRREGMAADDAAVRTMASIGTPAFVTTITLMCAFLMFIGADFRPNYYFGLLISLVIGLALLADLTLTPALLYRLERGRAAPAVLPTATAAGKP